MKCFKDCDFYGAQAGKAVCIYHQVYSEAGTPNEETQAGEHCRHPKMFDLHLPGASVL